MSKFIFDCLLCRSKNFIIFNYFTRVEENKGGCCFSALMNLGGRILQVVVLNYVNVEDLGMLYDKEELRRCRADIIS